MFISTMSGRRSRQSLTPIDGVNEEEKLFGTYISENKPTKERRIVYIVNALILSIAPVCKYSLLRSDVNNINIHIDLYYSIFNLSLKTFGIVFLVVSAASAYGIQMAYHNVAFSLNSRYQ